MNHNDFKLIYYIIKRGKALLTALKTACIWSVLVYLQSSYNVSVNNVINCSLII